MYLKSIRLNYYIKHILETYQNGEIIANLADYIDCSCFSICYNYNAL